MTRLYVVTPRFPVFRPDGPPDTVYVMADSMTDAVHRYLNHDTANEDPKNVRRASAVEENVVRAITTPLPKNGTSRFIGL